jgi:hypothetical protein
MSKEKKMKLLLALFLILCLSPLTLWAEQGDLPVRTSGFYAGGGVGYNQVDLKSEQLTISGSDLSYTLFAGYQFPAYSFLPFDTFFAVQGGYMDLGTVDDQALGAKFELDIHGFDLYAIGYLPITRRIDLFGKVGVFLWDAKVKADGATVDDDDGTDLALGFGMEYRTGKAYSARLTVESVDMLDGVWVATLAGIYQFK